LDSPILIRSYSTSLRGTAGLSIEATAVAILIAAASNNLLKASYAVSFAGRQAATPSAVALVVLAVAGLAVAYYLERLA
jgi:uncharacterized membrane protein (DUF4010 family)